MVANTVTTHDHPIRLRRSVFAAQPWRELVYVLADFPWTIAMFVIIFTLLSTGFSLTIIYVGIPIVMAGMGVARGAAWGQWRLARRFKIMDAGRPRAWQRKRSGVLGIVLDAFTDTAGWRSFGYFSFKFVWSTITFSVAVVFYSGLGMISYPVWRPFLPEVAAADGTLHRGTMMWNDTFIDTPESMLVFAAIGAALVLIAPYVVRGFLQVDRWAMREMLGVGNAATAGRLSDERPIA